MFCTPPLNPIGLGEVIFRVFVHTFSTFCEQLENIMILKGNDIGVLVWSVSLARASVERVPR